MAEADTVREQVSEAVAVAAANAGDAAAAVVAGAESQIAESMERVAAAEATAQAITDAAMHSATVAKANEALEELDEWEGEIEARLVAVESQNQSLTSQLTEALSRLEAMQVTITKATVQAEQPSILPGSEAPPVETVETVTVETVTPPERPAVTEDAPVVPAPKKRRWI